MVLDKGLGFFLLKLTADLHGFVWDIVCLKHFGHAIKSILGLLVTLCQCLENLFFAIVIKSAIYCTIGHNT